MNLENEITLYSGVEDEFDYSIAPTYVANAFTMIGDEVNLEVDNMNINCLTSKNNKFSLDEEGNLVVNSLTCNNTSSGTSMNLLDVYPIGSIYMSVNATNPSEFFGGVWEQWGSGRCPIGVDVAQTEFNEVGKIGGEKTHTLTLEQMPKHRHAIDFYKSTWSDSVAKDTNAVQFGVFGKDHIRKAFSDSSSYLGGGEAHNNLQPYITCYMWKRVA